MTDNSDKIRSIVLAALMVFSVFAGTVAFAGTAAAVSGNNAQTVTVNPDTGSSDETITASAGISTSSKDVIFAVDANGNGEIDSGEVAITATDGGSEDMSSSDGEVNVTIDLSNYDLSGMSSVDILVEGETGSDSENSQQDLALPITNPDASASFTVDAEASPEDPSLRKATHYVDSEDGAVIELAFTEGVTTAGNASVVVGFENGETEDLTSSVQTGTDGSDARWVVNTSSTVYSNVQNVTVSGIQDSSGNYIDETTLDVSFAPTTVKDGSTVDGYVGANVAFEANSTDTSIDFDGPSFSPTRGTGSGSEVFVVNTDDFEEGTYNASFSGGTEATLELSGLGLSVSAGDVTTDDAVEATIEADDINRDVDVVLLDSDDDEVATDTVRIDADGEAAVDFGQQDAGNYTIVATDVNTQVEANDSLTVSEADDAQAMFTQNTFTVAQGGIAEITVELDATTQGTLVVGDEQDDGYQANVTFTDENEDGEVTIQFNTYVAGDATNGTLVTAEGDDTAELIDGTNSETNLGPSDLLGQGGYDLAVDTGYADNGSVVTTSGDADFGSLSVGERSTDGMTLWTAPSSTDSDELLDSATQDDTIAAGDWVVHQVEATGLDGLVDGNLTAAFGNGVNVTVQQTAETTRQNRQPKSLNVTEAIEDGDIALVADAENNSYYIAVDSSTDAFERSSGSNTDGLSAAAGEDYTATFTIDDAKLVGEDEEDHESVNATFEVVERSATLDMTPVNLTATDNAEISGTTTLAPGSSVRVVVESNQGTSPRFYNNPTATVQDDGTWNVTVDLSEQSAGDTFEVRSSSGLFPTAAGNVVESTSTPTATATATATATEQPETETATATATATEAPETDTEAPDTETEEPDTETTTTTTPGFGVAVALVALLAAALLAGRRE